MSDDEQDPWERGSEEEEEEEEQEEEAKPAFKPKPAAPPAPVQKTEAQLAMERRRAEALDTAGIEEHVKVQVEEMLKANEQMRAAMDEEIQEMRARSDRRKAERKAEEERQAEQQAEEFARRKAELEEKKRKEQEEANKRREARAKRMAEFEKFQEQVEPQKSKEQLEAEKKAILAQRCQPLSLEGLGLTELIAKASELHNTIFRLESDKYDMETRFKKGQADMTELTEKARQMRAGGKGKATRADTEAVDKFQERFGAPPKITTYSSFDRRKDKRSYEERHQVFEGPQFLYPVGRIDPQRTVVWGYEGPEYGEGGAPPPRREPEPEPAPEPAEVAAE